MVFFGRLSYVVHGFFNLLYIAKTNRCKKAWKPLVAGCKLKPDTKLYDPMNPSWSLPPSMFEVRGAIGKQFVMKRYGKKTVVTRYPDMTRIVPTVKQKVRRRLFARVVRYAQSIYWKPELRAEWKRKLRRPRRLFQAMMKQYYRQLQQQAERRESRIRKWQRSVAVSSGLLQGALLSQPLPMPSLAYLQQVKATRKTRVERGALW